MACFFSFEGLDIEANVVDVYDGDTITVSFPTLYYPVQSEKVFKYKCRLYGINTPEIRNKDLEQKRKGIIARDALRQMIMNERVILKCRKFDCFGRILVNVIHGNVDVNEWMLEQGHARVFT